MKEKEKFYTVAPTSEVFSTFEISVVLRKFLEKEYTHPGSKK